MCVVNLKKKKEYNLVITNTVKLSLGLASKEVF